ncbi:MAG: hypothetical protein IID33_10030 [Planctomycetes bacterium]|nr:hypothetical protein [Planctomycetota bacterium]
MTGAVSILDAIEDAGVCVRVRSGRILCNPLNRINADLRHRIAEYNTQLIDAIHARDLARRLHSHRLARAAIDPTAQAQWRSDARRWTRIIQALVGSDGTPDDVRA